jgi:DNA polymerase-3 subunit delta'
MHQLFGHESTRRALAASLSGGRLPQVLLFTGDPGVGKQRLALWLAQLCFCTDPAGEPCGSCRGCRLVLDLIHPDLHWFVPLPRPKAGEVDKQVEEVRDALAAEMGERRTSPIYSRPDGMAMHGVASARLLLRLTALTPVEGGRRVVIIGDADRLVPQEASPEAANALLKFLEEPPRSTIVVLTTTDPSRVLPTIRSRSIPVRIGRLSEPELDRALATLLAKESAEQRRRRLTRAAGSLGRALEPGADEALPAQVAQLLDAVRQGGAPRYERILQQGPWSARGDFTVLLDRLAEALGAAARAAAASAAAPSPPVPPAGIADPRRVLAALEKVDQARTAAQGNVNPQLLLAVLSDDLAEALWA